MAGDYGKLDVSAYGFKRITTARIEVLETALSDWLASARPGSFTSRDAGDPYERARALFERVYGQPVNADAFEVALARCGFRAGCVVFKGEARWILILPSSLDTALTRMAEIEARPA